MEQSIYDAFLAQLSQCVIDNIDTTKWHVKWAGEIQKFMMVKDHKKTSGDAARSFRKRSRLKLGMKGNLSPDQNAQLNYIKNTMLFQCE